MRKDITNRPWLGVVMRQEIQKCLQGRVSSSERSRSSVRAPSAAGLHGQELSVSVSSSLAGHTERILHDIRPVSAQIGARHVHEFRGYKRAMQRPAPGSEALDA